ncbi:hypothetical protein CRU98_04565 [Arcobacter sp. CECT 8986]|uniref:Hachiman antiphage defense system protein HamA n=1 Tax=Arcobacter sp. CECT 8986 TaxID=2044507 RepID=UPI0010099E99|nr:Hachiman antiphage defense system protein HamA [Arcobacter sp. CECT 8986]RXK00435.1 hypothetical protein CRU98_04565 [Arcobacter sp. CECT 8986]
MSLIKNSLQYKKLKQFNINLHMEDTNMISGISFHQNSEDNVYICYIEEFSDELKERIVEMLSSIWHGSVDAEERPQFSYNTTVKRFLERYQTKTPDTKKGMIGELLTHLLMPSYINLKAISIMKNKEENSIRKGFDIVYTDENNLIWYCEVKSGGDTNTTENIDTKNKSLLNKARKDIEEHSMGDRATLWESVLIDVNSTIFNSERRFDIKNILDEDHPDTENRNLKRNVILSSVLYKKLDTKICPNDLKRYKLNIDSENIFVGLIVFSIQKETYSKIEDFLISQFNENNNG